MEFVVPPLRKPCAVALLALAALPLGCAAGGEVAPEDRDWLVYAREAELDGDWELAAHALDQWARFHPDRLDEAFLLRRAELADRAGRPDDAALARARLLRLAPEDDELRIRLADDLQAIGRGEEGLELLDKRIRETGAPLLREAKAQVLAREGRPLEAAALYEQLAAEQEDPVRAALLQTASAFYEKGGDVDSALRTIEEALGPERMSEEERRAIARMKALETGQPQNAQDALDLLRHHPEADFRLAGARYLALDRFPGDLAAFEQAALDTDARVRAIAVEQVGLRFEATAMGTLEAGLADPAPEVRMAALRALGEVGGTEQVPALIGALDPEDRAAFRAARRALERITGQLFGVGLDPRLEERRAIARQWEDWWTGVDGGGTGGGGA
jgi:tetratricopeptide (TPR) repeat protein